MRRALPLALVLCCLTAGCGALGGGPDPGTTGATDAVTPAPVERYPPGVTEETVTNASALLAAHEGVLANRSMTVQTTRTTTYPNGTLRRNVSATLRLAADHVRLASKSTVRFEDGRTVTGEGWANDTVGYTVSTIDEDRRYARYPPREIDPRAQLTPALPLFADQLTSENVTVERVDDGAVRITTDTLVPTDSRYANASLSMLVSDRGLVHEYRYTVDRPCGPNRCRTVTSTRFTDVGETTVERPAWMANASANVTTTPG